MKTITLHSLDDTKLIAEELAKKSNVGDVFYLKGDLGTGKSTFARFFIQFLCGEETIVPSPTFTLVQEYECKKGSLYHFDLYRLKDPEEAYELGIEDSFFQGISLIEWPEKIEGIKKPKGKILTFSLDKNTRLLKIDE